MSRRRRETLVRVAELQTRLAVRDLVAEQQRLAGAQAVRGDRQELLDGTGLAGGDPAALGQSTQLRLLRAAAVREADTAVRAALEASEAALHAWTAARRRQRAMEKLRDNARQEELARQRRAEQREADELAARRRPPVVTA